MQFGPLTLKHCKYGWMLFAGPIIGKCFELYGEYSEAEVAMMRGFVPEGGTVIDVGANIGDLTVPLSKMVGPAGRVLAMESHPDSFNVLCANLTLNRILNTRPINAFVATGDTVDTSSRVWGTAAYIGEMWPPQFVALDSLELARCDLIKVDVDGHELDVLKSGAMQIERFRPILYFENDTKDASADLLSYVAKELSYRLYWHLAPVFQPDNFFGNPVNHWAPKNVCSLMMLGIPAERKEPLDGLQPVVDINDWWDNLNYLEN